VFIPKRRKKVIFGKLRKHLGQFFHELAKQIKGGLCIPDKTTTDSDKSCYSMNAHAPPHKKKAEAYIMHISIQK